MPSLLPGFEYDVFISYRQNDNRSGWVTQFAQDLKEELAATIKEDVNIYFDENPHDGLQDSHHVNRSLEGKLRCLVFLPILSRTYCDPKSFAWNNEFLPFLKLSKADTVGLHVPLINGNVATRVLPVQVHDLEAADQHLFESCTESALRSIDFTFRSSGVNRPLQPEDSRKDNLSRAVYRDQINKVANALAEIFSGLKQQGANPEPSEKPGPNHAVQRPIQAKGFIQKVQRRNVLRAALVYIGIALLTYFLVNTYVAGAEQLAPVLIGLFAVGLVIALVLAWFYEKSPQGWVRTTSEYALSNPYPPHRRKPLTAWWFMLSIGLVIIYFVLQPKPIQEKSIAVLPFEYRSPVTQEAYLADAFAEDIINQLYVIGGVRVISHATSRLYKEVKKTTKEIADELKVATLLRGSIQRDQKTLKVTVTLEEGSTNEIIWAKSYQRTETDLLAIETEISRQVAGVLKLKIDERAETKLSNIPSDMTAYEYFAKGRNLYTYSNADSMDRASQEYKKAITLEPNYAQAYAGLADVYLQLHARFARGRQWIDSAIQVAGIAIRLDSNLSDGYKALGAAHNYARRYDTAFYYFKKSVEKNPYNAQAIGNLGAAYFLRLDYAEALRQYKRAAGLNPQHPINFQAIGWIYRLLGDLPHAEEYCKKSIERRPVSDAYRELAFTYLSQGRNAEAIALIPDILKLGNRGTRSLEISGRILHFAGDLPGAKAYFLEAINANPSYKNDANSVSSIALGQIFMDEANLAEAEIYLTHAVDLYRREIDQGSDDDDPPFNVAAAYAIQGKRAETIAYLKLAIERKWIDIAQVEKGPYFVKLRHDPEIRAMMAALLVRVKEIRNSIE